ncbi:MAG: TrmO family methyltransferase [Pseudomonadota bacterium]
MNEKHLQANFQPIGYVYHDTPDTDVSRQRRVLESAIVIEPQYRLALTGIGDYSHLFVIFWLHESPAPEQLLVHPRGKDEYPLTGLLATRGRSRPNPIGLAVAELLACNLDAGELRVRRVDAYSGTPILDLKPYDTYDIFEKVSVPPWFSKNSSR